MTRSNMGIFEGFERPIWQRAESKWKVGQDEPSEIVMGQISKGLIGSIKDFDLYSKSNGKYVCSLNRKLFAKETEK